MVIAVIVVIMIAMVVILMIFSPLPILALFVLLASAEVSMVTVSFVLPLVVVDDFSVVPIVVGAVVRIVYAIFSVRRAPDERDGRGEKGCEYEMGNGAFPKSDHDEFLLVEPAAQNRAPRITSALHRWWPSDLSSQS